MTEIALLSNLAATYNALGDYHAAEGAARQGIEHCAVNEVESYGDLTYALAEAILGQGRVQDALVLAQQALSMVTATESPRDIGIAWRVLAMALSASGDSEAAEAAFTESERHFVGPGAIGERARIPKAWARHTVASGDTERARAYLAAARALFTAGGLEHELNRMASEPGI